MNLSILNLAVGSEKSSKELERRCSKFFVLAFSLFVLFSCKEYDRDVYIKVENQSDKEITEIFFYTTAGYAYRFHGLKGNTTADYVWYDFDYAIRSEGGVDITVIRPDTVLNKYAIHYYINEGFLAERHWNVVVKDKEVVFTDHR